MSFTCPRCHRVSHHPMDEENGYCGACHAFTRDEMYDAMSVQQMLDIAYRESTKALAHVERGKPIDLNDVACAVNHLVSSIAAIGVTLTKIIKEDADERPTQT